MPIMDPMVFFSPETLGGGSQTAYTWVILVKSRLAADIRLHPHIVTE